MRSLISPGILIGLALVWPSGLAQKATGVHADTKATAADNSSGAPEYSSDGRLVFPAHYREWIYLTSGIDMSYSPKADMADHSMFDNVFASPAAYRAFQQTGTWPDKTVLVLEIRGAESKGSINQRGHFQSTGLMGFEVHVKDEVKTPGKWAFYEFDNDKPTQKIPEQAACYSCHEQHGAVATTFVQFYPTLLRLRNKRAR